MDNLQSLCKYIQQQQDALRKLIAPYEAMHRYAHEVIAPFEESARRMAAQTEATQKAMRPFYEAIERIRQQQEAWAKSIRGIMEDVPKRMRKVQEYLFERGWYLGPEASLPGINTLAKMIDDGRHEEIEKVMQSWAEQRIDAILKKIETDFPARRTIIEDAVSAHRNGKYTLSVPVLFAQADGLAREIIGTFLFRGKPVKDFERLLSSLEPFGVGSTLDALVTPLRSYSTLGKKPKKSVLRGAQEYASRHDVLHGTSTDYATRANSLRVTSLIDYLLGIKDMFSSHKEWARQWRRQLEEIPACVDKAMDTEGTAPLANKVR